LIHLNPVDNPKVIGRGTWYDKAASELIKREKKLNRSLDNIRTESGLGASGYPHIGSLGDALRNYAISLALRAMSYKSEYIAFADDKDGLRKVPEGMPKELEKYVGFSVAAIPDIFGDCHFSFGEHMSSLLKEALDLNRVKYTPMSAFETYKNGVLNNEIITLLDNHEKVGKIIERVTGQEKFTESLPYFVVCENCGRIYTTFTHDYNPKTNSVYYECQGMEVKGQWLEGCGYKGEIDVLSGNGKLSWKVEFGARWHALDIRFEAYGKDIADSVHVNDAICREIFNWEPPMHVQYEMFVDRGGKKISKSAGNVFTPQVWYRYGSIASLNLLIFKRFIGTKSGSVEDIPLHMDELDDLEDIYFNKKKIKDELERYKLRGLYEYSFLLNPPSQPEIHIPFNLMIKLAKNAPRGAEREFIKIKLQEYNYFKETNKGIDNRIQRALNWIEDFDEEIPISIDLSDLERKAIQEIAISLQNATSEEEYQSSVFMVSKKLGIKVRKLFPILYGILLGKPQGPRFGPYVSLMGKDNVIKELVNALENN
jgi:lysyl-tRNA synthetase class 1